MEIFSVNVREGISPFLRKNMLSIIDSERKRKISQMIRQEDQDRTLVAHALLKILCRYRYKIPFTHMRLNENSYGKPYISYEKFHFNLSHSGSWVVCVIDNQEVGIDVEYMHQEDTRGVEAFFSIQEQAKLNQLQEKERQLYFYDLWTIKESYIKMMGKGLFISLDSFVIQKKKGNFYIQTFGKKRECFFKQYDIERMYRLSVCAKHNAFPSKINEVSLEEIKNGCQKW